jgi:hypothetical protein
MAKFEYSARIAAQQSIDLNYLPQGWIKLNASAPQSSSGLGHRDVVGGCVNFGCRGLVSYLPQFHHANWDNPRFNVTENTIILQPFTTEEIDDEAPEFNAPQQ